MPKKTVELIINSGNDYLIAVKGNQKTLHNQIKQHLQSHQPLDSFFEQEKNRGRLEQRFVAIYTRPKQLAARWDSVQRVVFVRRTGYRPNKGLFVQELYYILSKQMNKAEALANAIRGHWFIENKLHHVKDVHFGEDDSKIKDGQAAAILSIIQDIAINLFRCKGYKSIKTATIHFANKVKELKKFLSANHISDL